MYIFSNQILDSRAVGMKGGKPCSMAKYLVWTKKGNFAKLRVSRALPKMSFESIKLKLLWEQRAWTDRIIIWNPWTPLGFACLLIVMLGKAWEQMWMALLMTFSKDLLCLCTDQAANCLAWIISFSLQQSSYGQDSGGSLVSLIRKVSLRNLKKPAYGQTAHKCDTAPEGGICRTLYDLLTFFHWHPLILLLPILWGWVALSLFCTWENKKSEKLCGSLCCPQQREV